MTCYTFHLLKAGGAEPISGRDNVDPSQLATDVFQAIAAHYVRRADAIGRFADQGYSFEEWLNWEALDACSRKGWHPQARPSYRKLGVADCRDYGDLLVQSDVGRVLVEVGLVHDGTGNKWIAKLDWDAQKLARCSADMLRLQIIVLTSCRQIEGDAKWDQWLRRVGCWGRPTQLARKSMLPPRGQMVIRGPPAGMSREKDYFARPPDIHTGPEGWSFR